MRCVVASAKITDYLLNLDHPVGGAKARFFLGGGFSVEHPEGLALAMQRHFESRQAQDTGLDRLGGLRIVVTAPLPTPDGRAPNVTSVWIVEDDDMARFVTAYPAD